MRNRIVAATCASVLMGGGLSLTLSGLTATDAVYASVQKAKSLADLLGARSPGERTEAQLTKHQHARALARHRFGAPPLVTDKPLTPDAMALARILLPPAAEQPVDIGQPVPLAQLVAPPSLGSIVIPPSSGAPAVTPPGGPGGTTPGGGGKPGGGSPPIITPPTSAQLMPAVPEPGTWAMMLLGFGFIGWRVRRDRPAAQQATA